VNTQITLRFTSSQRSIPDRVELARDMVVTQHGRVSICTSNRARSLVLFCSLIAAVGLAQAQTKMFKCVVDGRTSYQQTACSVSSPATDAKPIAEPAATPRASASGASSRAGARAAPPQAIADGSLQTQARSTIALREVQR
jgi:hypothetical protein